MMGPAPYSLPSLSQGWNLLPVAIYALLAGIDAILVGTRILNLGLTKEPLISAVGFILAGLGGVGSVPLFLWFKGNKTYRMIGVVILLITAAIWAVSFYGALWGHLESFGKWLPATMMQ